MAMSYHQDWESAEKRLTAFWHREAIGRACLQIHAPSSKPIKGPAHPPHPATIEERWTNVDYITALADYRLRTTFWGGEAVPCHWINLGPGFMATYLGSEPIFHPDTVWFGPTGYNYDKPLAMNEESPWWRLTKELTLSVAKELGGRGITGITDLGGGSDILASLRTSEGLLFDTIENPEGITMAMEEISDIWIRCYQELYAITSAFAPGSLQWLELWAPGMMYNIQSDFCCMVSPAMFERFIAPELQKLCRFLDYSLYHLDGPGATVHLDRLLAIPELDGIQWTPGDGTPPVTEWIPMLKRVQAAGKCLHLHGAPQHAEKVLRVLKPEGLIFNTWCSTEEEARDILRLAETWCAGPREE